MAARGHHGRGHVRSVAAAVAIAAIATACTLVLDPERLDDVYRCEFDYDCPSTEDPRYELQCLVSEEYAADPDFPKICSPRPAVSCDPNKYDYRSDIRTRWRDAMSIEGRYAEACMDPVAVRGCMPNVEGCAPGLTPHPESGRCDDEDPTTPPAISPLPVVAAQDVLDQFCRSIFCDQQFVCDKRDYECVPCTLGDSLGRGGCGDLYLQGERSNVYKSQEALADECRGADMDDFDDVALPPL